MVSFLLELQFSMYFFLEKKANMSLYRCVVCGIVLYVLALLKQFCLGNREMKLCEFPIWEQILSSESTIVFDSK